MKLEDDMRNGHMELGCKNCASLVSKVWIGSAVGSLYLQHSSGYNGNCSTVTRLVYQVIVLCFRSHRLCACVSSNFR
jgi:hypothetical protein